MVNFIIKFFQIMVVSLIVLPALVVLCFVVDILDGLSMKTFKWDLSKELYLALYDDGEDIYAEKLKNEL